MKHNFNSPVSYDTDRLPVNKVARRMLSRQPQLDLSDERASDALAMAEILQGSGALARGVSTTEVASLIVQWMPKKPQAVETTLAPDLMALRKQELDFRREQERNMKAARKEKQLHISQTREDGKEYDRVFRETAKAWMSEKDYSVLVDLTLEERNRRIAMKDVQSNH